jgi:hypothetical protein
MTELILDNIPLGNCINLNFKIGTPSNQLPMTGLWDIITCQSRLAVKKGRGTETINEQMNAILSHFQGVITCRLNYTVNTAGGDCCGLREAFSKAIKNIVAGWTFSIISKMRFSILTTAAFATLISTVSAAPNPQPPAIICPIGIPIPEYC